MHSAWFYLKQVWFLACLFSLSVLQSSIVLASQGPDAWDLSSVPKSVYTNKVTELRVEGNRKIETEAILKKILIQKGDLPTPELVQESIRALYRMGFFDSIDFYAETSGSRTSLIVKVKERPVIHEIRFEGNDEDTSDDLIAVISTKQFSLLEINKIQQDIEALKKHYEDKGFYLVKISYDIQHSPAQRDQPEGVIVTFKIQEFDQVEVKRILFMGNRVFSDARLKQVMETREGSFWSFLSGAGQFKEESFKADMQRLQLFYLSEGYVRVKFEEPIVTVSDDKKWVEITLKISEGEKYKIGEVLFEGDLLFSVPELEETTKLKKGDWFSNIKLRNDIQALTEKYQDQGYAYANVVPRSDINDVEKRVDITYQIDKGNLTYIGRINVSGNSKTRDKVVRRELEVYEGELFNGTGMRRSRANVERLGFFEPNSVKIVYNPSERDPNVVDVDVTIKERQTGQLTLGAGYSSATKSFFTFQVAQNNLFGKGQELSAQAQLSKISKTYSLSFTEPYFMDSKWSVGFSLFRVVNSITNSHTYRRTGFDVRWGYPVFEYTRFFMTYKFDVTKITDIINQSTLIQSRPLSTLLEELGEGTLSSIRFQLVRDVRNNRFEPTDGDFESASTEWAGLGGDKKFNKSEADFRIYRELTEQGWVFRSRLKMGALFRTAAPQVPVDERFFLGGPQSLKGFRDFTVSPFDGYRPIGGHFQAFTNIEFEHPLIREAGIKGVLFYDVGNSWEKFPLSSGEGSALLQDYGFGIRWFSPVGVLRFEFGYPIKAREEPVQDISPFFSFMIGPPF